MGLLPKIRRANEALDIILRDCRIEAGSAYVSLFGIWESVAGVHIAAHCRPVDVQHGTLIVEADNPAWTAEIQYVRADIVDRLRERLPELNIKNIRVYLVRG